jgi:hypothetical protein
MLNSENLNRWLNLIANTGVLIGIVLILIELNQNADLMRAQISQSRSDNLAAKYRDNIHSDHWAKIAAKRSAAGNPETWVRNLDAEELQRVRSYLLMEVNDIRNQYYQYVEGYLDQDIWDGGTRGQIIRFLAVRPYFFPKMMKLDPGFLNELNRIALEEGLETIDDTGSWRGDFRLIGDERTVSPDASRHD